MEADLLERLVRLETQVDTVIERLDHQDSCVDALKRQVWIATGAISLLVVLVNIGPGLLRILR